MFIRYSSLYTKKIKENFMTDISITINKDLHKKIAKIAEKNGLNLNECIVRALNGYVEDYEDVYKTDICAVDNLERSFFLSIGE